MEDRKHHELVLHSELCMHHFEELERVYFGQRVLPILWSERSVGEVCCREETSKWSGKIKG